MSRKTVAPVLTADERAFYRGFAAAVATLARDHDQPSSAVDIMHSNGVNLDHLRAAGVDAFDRLPLARAWRDDPKGARLSAPSRGAGRRP
jgi:hypothetical protein